MVPAEAGALESEGTERCPLVEKSPDHQGPLDHPAPERTITAQ